MRMPTFSRHSSTDTADDERPTLANGPQTAPVMRPSEETTTRWVDNDRGEQTAEMPRVDQIPAARRRRVFDERNHTDTAPVAAGPKPRASLLATLGLIGGVAAALLVLSGPLLPYGIGLAVLALILSVSGMHATGRRHVAGKTDASIGMMLSLAAIVVGVLALTGSLSWLGTDMQPVATLRQWLDAHTVNQF